MKKNLFRYFIILSINLNLIAAENIDVENVDDEKDYQEIECKLIPIIRLRDSNDDLFKSLADRVTHPHIPVENFRSNGISSNNWAGYVVAKNFTNPVLDSVTFVEGFWKVPSIKHSNKTTYCATWVGIDGFNNHTVEQIGTEQEYIVSKSFTGQYNYAWVEMFPQNAQIIGGFPVNVGDVIKGSVTFMGDNKFNLTLVNRTRKVKTKLIKSLSNQAQRICAEWIVEAPFLNGVLPLGNFGTVNWKGCIAKIDGIKGSINNSNWLNLPITMQNPNGTVKAITSKLNAAGKGFNVKWKHS